MAIQEIAGNMVFRLSSRRSPKEVNLRNIEWAVVTQLDGEKTVDQIAGILALSPGETKEIFTRLLTERLLDLVTISSRSNLIDPEILARLEYELKTYVGPVAGYLVEETLEELNRNRDNLDVAILPVLIDLLTAKIGERERQIDFQRSIYPDVREYFINR